MIVRDPSDQRIIILGAGPTGLGAAYRLNELGNTNFHLYERSAHVGGLATSHRDREGFLWDVGGHILDSHYEYFENLLNCAVSEGWLHHPRQTRIRMDGRDIPYPLQYHLRHLSPEMRWCHRRVYIWFNGV